MPTYAMEKIEKLGYMLWHRQKEQLFGRTCDVCDDINSRVPNTMTRIFRNTVMIFNHQDNITVMDIPLLPSN